ncbi:hypothetical protein BDZ89DRAFT_1227462 [Hymenopellis radicata]|nr:hypothetical protein BDZ89DRAFT_1227462 [Hymenopellis radicata]
MKTKYSHSLYYCDNAGSEQSDCQRRPLKRWPQMHSNPLHTLVLCRIRQIVDQESIHTEYHTPDPNFEDLLHRHNFSPVVDFWVDWDDFQERTAIIMLCVYFLVVSCGSMSVGFPKITKRAQIDLAEKLDSDDAALTSVQRQSFLKRMCKTLKGVRVVYFRVSFSPPSSRNPQAVNS